MKVNKMKQQNLIKVQKRYSRILFLFVTVAITSSVISLALSMVNIGLSPNFLQAWARSYAIAFAIAIPVAFFASWFAENVVARLTV